MPWTILAEILSFCEIGKWRPVAPWHDHDHWWNKSDPVADKCQGRLGPSRNGCSPNCVSFSRIFKRVTPSQRAARAWLPWAI